MPEQDLAAQLAQLKGLYEQGLLSEANVRAALAGLDVSPEAIFGHQVADASDMHGAIYTGPPPKNRKEELDIYLRVVAQTCGQLPLRSVDVGASDTATGQKGLNLANIYVDLDTRTQIEDKAKAKRQGPAIAGRRQSRWLSALEAAFANRRMVLLGEPGSGKTTFVYHLAHCLAAHLLQPETNALAQLPGWQEPDALPVLVLVRDLARSLPDPLPGYSEPHHLLDFIAARLRAQNMAFAVPLVQAALEKSRALVLLDGLDQAPTVALRSFVPDAVTAFANRYPGNRYLVTCRVLAYQAPAKGAPDLRLPDFSTFELAAFDENKIQHFVNAWYTELAALNLVRAEDASGLARQLYDAVRRADLWRLAPNPLLLTVMALVHAYKGRLPDARAMLYEDTVDIFLWRREPIKAGGQEQAPPLRHLLTQAGRTDVDLKRALWRLAFEAHARTQGDDQDSLADIDEWKLQKALAALKGDDAAWARQAMEAIKLHAGLLVERAPKVFTFPHCTFQEYLAGAHLAAQADFASQACSLAEQSLLWRDVILFGVGRLVYLAGDTDKPLALVDELCPNRASNDVLGWRKAWLAGDVLNEIGVGRVCDSAVGRDLLARARERLVGVLASPLAPRERAAAGNTLARLGDPRFRVETWYLPDEPLWGFIEIPAGKFIMGEDQERHKLDLHPFYVARYPVTNAQFSMFTQAGGYREQRYWAEAEAAGVWHDGRVQGFLESEPRDAPRDQSEPFNASNHPVAGIMWYEALAYCRWLTELLRASARTPEQLAALLREGWLVTLPSEAEWERAARGTQGWAFPWRDEPDPNRANYDEAGIGATSAVGCFPNGASPCGCKDMSGNVWEWTRSIYKDYPYNPKDGRESFESPDARVLRGGSFYDNRDYTRCATRRRDYADFGWFNVGFRVVVCPP